MIRAASSTSPRARELAPTPAIAEGPSAPAASARARMSAAAMSPVVRFGVAPLAFAAANAGLAAGCGFLGHHAVSLFRVTGLSAALAVRGAALGAALVGLAGGLVRAAGLRVGSKHELALGAAAALVAAVPSALFGDFLFDAADECHLGPARSALVEGAGTGAAGAGLIAFLAARAAWTRCRRPAAELEAGPSPRGEP